MVVLWLLLLRGIAIESRHLLHHVLWAPFWDVVFSGASALLAIFFGAALGNVVRGVNFDENYEFFLPFWGSPGILDWYTVLVALLAFAALVQHGALWVAYRTHEPIESRALIAARRAFWAVAVLTPLVTAASATVRPQLFHNFSTFPPGAVFPILAAAGLVAVFRAKTRSAGFSAPAPIFRGC